MNRTHGRLVAAATLCNLGLAVAILAFAGSGRDGTELALRSTARVSFVWFLLAFLATPLARLRPGALGEWLLDRRGAIGIVFGLSMSMHVAFILRLYWLYAPARPPMVNDTDFSIGIPGLVFVALMTATSFLEPRRRLGEAWWHRLHTTGIYFVWSIFFLCLVDSVGRKNSDHPLLAYYAFIAALVGAMTLRIAAAAAMRRRRPEDRLAPSARSR
jgi:methionine sulfoxide reductase heme-binding subunit